MDKTLLEQTVGTIITRYPQVIPHLGGDVFAVMTVDYFQATLSRMVSNVYTSNMGGEFVDILGALIRGQMKDAYNRAYADAGFSDALPDWLGADLEAIQTDQASFDYIYQYYKDIVDSQVDGKPLQPLLDRVSLWSNRWKEAYSRANVTIQSQLGGRLMWKEGDTVDKCETCVSLNGIVAFATEWELSGFKPQGSNLICGGWNCGCELVPTDKRRSKNAWDRIMSVPAHA